MTSRILAWKTAGKSIKPKVEVGLLTSPLSSKNVNRREYISAQQTDDRLNPSFSVTHELPDVGKKQGIGCALCAGSKI